MDLGQMDDMTAERTEDLYIHHEGFQKDTETISTGAKGNYEINL